MRRVPKLVLPILTLLLSGAGALPAAAAGGWTTYLRAEQYTGLAARHDTIWCASNEGGLQRFVRSAGTFESFTREPDGLASQALTALEFDRSGRLWIGTRDQGVSRLSADGSRWSLVSRLDGLPEGAVTALRAFGDTVLIGTEKGLALWNGREIAGTVPDGVNPSDFASDVITGLLLQGDSLWVATQLGLYVGRPSTGLAKWDTLSAFADNPVTGLAWDGRTLMAVSSGVPLVFDFAARTWSAADGIGAVLSLTDRLGTILACTTAGVYRWTGSAWQALLGAPASQGCAVASDPACKGIAAATVDASGRVWVANRDGLREWDSVDWVLHEPDAPAGNNIQNIALQGARVYVTTFIEGVGRFDGERWRNWLPRDCASGCETTFRNSAYAFSLLVDRKGMKWVGCWGSAMESFEDDGAEPQFIHHRPSDSLGVEKHTFGWCAAADDSGGRWFGMDTNGLGEDPTPIGIEYYDSSGVYRANYRTENTPAMPGSQIRALVVDDKRKQLWVGYRGKGVTVFKLPRPGGPLELATNGSLSSIGSLEIFGIVADGDSMWVMSTGDLRRFHAVTFQQVGSPRPLVGSPATPGACHPMDVGPDGTVWVGTDGGAHAYGRDGSVVEYTALNSPLAGDEVRAIRVDRVSGVVWFGTATGLSRFDPHYVAPPPPELPSLEVRAYPNPAWLTGAGLTLRLVGNATAYRGAVYDASGRKLCGFAGQNGQVFWDGRDASGALVRPGVYFVRVEASGRARTVRVALLR
jgi:ligand-binding sensor domain-containing protein